MKTITKTYNIYSFAELTEEAKEKAIEKVREQRYKFGEPLYFFEELCIEKAEKEGFINPKFQWSLNYCQGDGLSFEADGFKLEKLKNLFLNHLGKGKEKTALLLAENCSVIIKGNTGHYSFASSSDVDLYIENYTSSINCTNIDNIDEICGYVLSDFENIYVDLCNELEKDGYAEIEYYFSDEAIIEDIEANDCEFTEDGKPF